MNTSIHFPTPEDWEDRGARGYLDGLGENDHGLHPQSPTRKHWQYGWHQQRVLCERAGQQLAEVSPP